MSLTRASLFQVLKYHQTSWSVILFLLAAIVDIVPGRAAFKSKKEGQVFSEVTTIHQYGNLIDESFGTTPIESQLITLNKTDRMVFVHTPLRREKRSLSATSIRMPGTNWCGGGWRAEHFEQLGSYGPTDKCCRQHDLGCPAAIQPGDTVLGLENNRYFTMMHCSCDERFRSCLKMVGTSTATTVGRLFFSLLQTPCFVLDTEKVCTEYTWWGKCIKEERRTIAVMKDAVPF